MSHDGGIISKEAYESYKKNHFNRFKYAKKNQQKKIKTKQTCLNRLGQNLNLKSRQEVI